MLQNCRQKPFVFVVFYANKVTEYDREGKNEGMKNERIKSQSSMKNQESIINEQSRILVE